MPKYDNDDYVDELFKIQDKELKIKDEKLIKYRSKAKKTISTPIDIKKIDKLKGDVKKIKKETLDFRDHKYGQEVWMFKIEYIGNDYYFTARNRYTGKFVDKIPYNNKESENKNTLSLIEKIRKKPFNYKKFYIKEDLEPDKDETEEDDKYISYNTYYRYGLFIYRMKQGRKYEIIYQNSNTQARSEYVSYQRIIAQIKEDVLNSTNITLEQWLYLSRVMPNIYIEGGIKYTRYKNIVEVGKSPIRKKEYTIDIDFERDL